MRHVALLLSASLLAAPWSALADEPAKPRPDAFAPLRFLEGTWVGTGKGEPGEAQVEWTFGFVLRGGYLELRAVSVYPPQPSNPKGERHEELGMFSFDRTRQRLVWRQFTVERFVNQYLLELGPGDALVFTTEAIENLPPGWRARETFRRVGADGFSTRFEIAEPGKDFKVYTENHLTRRR
jgi:hypothetical protein